MKSFKYLSESVKIKTISETATHGVFDIEGLFAGYGLTIGNSLRRILLSSLPGAAITQLKIKNVSHEFSTLPGVKEDIIELSLNFKKLRFRTEVDELQVLKLKAKGEGVVKAGDIKLNAQIEIINPEEVLAILTEKSADLDIEITIERGLGYSPVESRNQDEKLAIGVIALDAFFSPVVNVNYDIENMRVGDRTDYNRLKLEVTTDGTISPSSALHKSANILNDHFQKISEVSIQEFEVTKAAKSKVAGKKKKE